jgi:hypothetical protein
MAYPRSRSPTRPRRAQAFRFVPDRLSVLDAIAWKREGRTIHAVAASAP